MICAKSVVVAVTPSTTVKPVNELPTVFNILLPNALATCDNNICNKTK